MSRRLVTFFLLFWLPLQGWGVSVMPFARHGGMMWMPAATEQAPHCMEHPAGQRESPKENPDGCGLCHLASAPTATAFVASLFSPITGDAVLPAILLPAPDAVPDTLNRPPIG